MVLTSLVVAFHVAGWRSLKRKRNPQDDIILPAKRNQDPVNGNLNPQNGNADPPNCSRFPAKRNPLPDYDNLFPHSDNRLRAKEGEFPCLKRWSSVRWRKDSAERDKCSLS